MEEVRVHMAVKVQLGIRVQVEIRFWLRWEACLAEALYEGELCYGALAENLVQLDTKMRSESRVVCDSHIWKKITLDWLKGAFKYKLCKNWA